MLALLAGKSREAAQSNPHGTTAVHLWYLWQGFRLSQRAQSSQGKTQQSQRENLWILRRRIWKPKEITTTWTGAIFHALERKKKFCELRNTQCAWSNMKSQLGTCFIWNTEMRLTLCIFSSSTGMCRMWRARLVGKCSSTPASWKIMKWNTRAKDLSFAKSAGWTLWKWVSVVKCVVAAPANLCNLTNWKTNHFFAGTSLESSSVYSHRTQALVVLHLWPVLQSKSQHATTHVNSWNGQEVQMPQVW